LDVFNGQVKQAGFVFETGLRVSISFAGLKGALTHGGAPALSHGRVV
jgi:hypothetical protein